MVDVVSVRPLPNYRLHLVFDDGVEGEVDFREVVPFVGVFAPMRDPKYFAQVRVHPEFKVVFWPNDADIDSDVLHAKITGTYDELMSHRAELAEA